MTKHPGAIIRPYNGIYPRIDPTAFIAPGACVIGDVTIGAFASVWYNCVLRADLNRIVIGPRSNVQDGTIIHVEPGNPANQNPGLPTLIGADALIGHRALLHGCVVEDRGFVGMGATVMDGARVATDAMLAAGSLLTPGRTVASGELWAGSPARFVRPLTEAQIRHMSEQAAHYVELAERHMR